MSIVVDNTPVEQHPCGDRMVWVKREDLCSPDPGPKFAKIRGVYSHIQSRPEDCIGVLDTYHSRAGWAVAYVCRELGKACVNFYPRYVSDTGLRPVQTMAKKLGAAVRPLTAGRSAILYHTAKKLMPEGGYLMPNALKLEETVQEVSLEAERTSELADTDLVILSISSATIAAGVMRGLERMIQQNKLRVRPTIVLHMGYSRSEDSVRRYVWKLSGYEEEQVLIVDEGFAYRDFVKDVEVPFPCDPYYDRKAWKWLDRTLRQGDIPPGLKILFWNVG